MNEPKVADTKPFITVLEPGYYSWCSCGYSEMQPYCDGAHMGKGFCPQTLQIEASKKVAFCLCKHTKNPPYCDGSHSGL